MTKGLPRTSLTAQIADKVLALNLFPTGNEFIANKETDKHSKRDPLSSQMWRLYTKAKDSLPNGCRVENLTWRMMAMTLKKDNILKDDDRRNIGDEIENTLNNVNEPTKEIVDSAGSGFDYADQHHRCSTSLNITTAVNNAFLDTSSVNKAFPMF
ncbi:hypothetical protein BDF20DRAFT_700191 [Mycotypha africana]|uniref:uncharacterized protein n=1 Tax=Mycotypha africana TaxID=64632 RepID=UPI0023009E9D|nr:uncharacterized protein BDF20DRAFT_700191 [Mycotypha africana]KAI8971816.1 hypothetical protein BDF20DRAFT_700191 [Mycotypha africana]